jgi:hypothetical protein
MLSMAWLQPEHERWSCAGFNYAMNNFTASPAVFKTVTTESHHWNAEPSDTADDVKPCLKSNKQMPQIPHLHHCHDVDVLQVLHGTVEDSHRCQKLTLITTTH